MTTNNSKFRNKDGSLTRYSFACGYVEVGRDGWRLYRDGCCYHVKRSFNEWFTFDGLTEARKFMKMKGRNK